MAGIVHARCHLVEQQRWLAPIPGDKEFDRESPDIVERLADAARLVHGDNGKPRSDPRRHHRPVQDVVAMLVLDDIVGTEFTAKAARCNHRHLTLEVDESFQDRRRIADRGPGGSGILDLDDLDLPLAVIAKAPRLEDRGRADAAER